MEIKQNDKMDLFSTTNTLLRGAGQVMFQSSAWCGALFLTGILWSAIALHTPEVAVGALLGLAVPTATGALLRLDRSDGENGLWGFNGILVGCALPTFLGNGAAVWILVVLMSAFTVPLREGLNRVMAKHRINPLTIPFVISTWIVLLAAPAAGSVSVAEMPAPSLPAHHTAITHLTLLEFLSCTLKGISQIFLIESWPTGLLFLTGLFISNRMAALWAFAGSAAALCAALLLGAPAAWITSGLCGFNPALTAIALATVFHHTNRRSAAWALAAVVVTLLVQLALATLFTPFGLATLTAPFCITTWLFLLPLIPLDEAPAPDHSQWHKQ